MLAWMHLTRKINYATITSVSNLTLSSSPWQAPASAAHLDVTRCLLSARTVYSFSASQASAFTECGYRCRVGSFVVQRLYSSEIAQIHSKRMTTTATPELQADSRQYFALTYDYVPDVLEKRGLYRPEHLALAQAQESEGKLLLGGAWGDPVDGALLIWHVHSADEVQQFVDRDPYVKNGLVTKVDIRPVAAVVGAWVTAAKK